MSDEYRILIDANARLGQNNAPLNGLGIQITNGCQFHLSIATEGYTSSAAEGLALLIALRQVPKGCRAVVLTDFEILQRGLRDGFKIGNDKISSHLEKEVTRLGKENTRILKRPRFDLRVCHNLASYGVMIAKKDVRGSFIHSRERKKAFGVIHQGMRWWKRNEEVLTEEFSNIICHHGGRRIKNLPVLTLGQTGRIMEHDMNYTAPDRIAPKLDDWVFNQASTVADRQ